MSEKMHIVIPGTIDWPVIERDPKTGDLLFPPGFLEAIADANKLSLPWHGDKNLPPFTEDMVSEIITKWYFARLDGGYPHDPVLDQLLREVEAEDGLPEGSLNITAQPVPDSKN